MRNTNVKTILLLRKKFYSLSNTQYNDCFENHQLLKPIQLRDVLLGDESFCNSKYFYSQIIFYLYDCNKGVYVKKNPTEMISIVSFFFSSIKVSLPFITAKAVVNELTVSCIGVEGDSEKLISYNHISFINGTLNMSTNCFDFHTPDVFCVRFVNKSYTWGNDPTYFLSFLKHLSDGNKTRALALRCFLKKLLCNNNYAQNFIYMHGNCMSGKSTFVNLSTYLVGDEYTTVTSLKAIQKDNFELSFMKNSRLVILSEMDKNNNTVDLGVLKSLISSDKVRSRRKFSNENNDFRLVGNIICHSNHKLDISSDNTGSLERRIRVIRADKRVEVVLDLLSVDINGNYKGFFETEFVPILQYCLSLDLDFANCFLKDEYQLLSSDKFGNTVNEFIESHLYFEEDSILLAGAGKNEKKSYDTDCLIPRYNLYLSSLDEDNQKCSNLELIETITGYYGDRKQMVKYFRTSKGMGLTNLKLYETPISKAVKDYVVSDNTQKMLDEVYSFPSKKEVLLIEPEFIIRPTFSSVSESEYSLEYPDLTNSIYLSWDSSVVHNSFLPLVNLNNSNRLYEEYASLYNTCDYDFKNLLNTYFVNSKKLEPLLLVKNYYKMGVEETINNTALKSALRTCKANLKKLKHICYLGRYTHMGTSPRIKPAHYVSTRVTLSNVSKVTRNGVWNFLSEHVDNYTVVDVDISSCYAGIVIGLYPDLYPILKKALDSNLWAYIEEHDFVDEKKKYYDKKLVKIVVYSTFFSGGRKAYLQGVLDSERNARDLTVDEFKKLEDYESIVQEATNFVIIMENSSIVREAKKASLFLSKKLLKTNILGGAGASFNYQELCDWPTIFSSILSSYEFSIVSGTTLMLKFRRPKVIFIHPFHDGFTVLVKKDEVQDVIDTFNECITLRCKQLKFLRPVALEYNIM